MASSVIIREGTPEDCLAIIQLIKELAVYEKEAESIVQIDENTLRKDGFSEDKWFETVIAEVTIEQSLETPCQKRIVGYAFYFRTYSTWNGRTMKVEDLYVKPSYRGQEIGTKLLKTVTEKALNQNCVRVHWNVLAWNEPAKDFYKKIGTDLQEDWRVCILHKPEMQKYVQT